MALQSFPSAEHVGASRMYIFLFVIAAVTEKSCCSNKFLSDKGGSLNQQAFRDDVMNAMGSILGCGGQADPSQLEEINAVVEPMWQTMPKTKGRIDRRSLRYLAHRYFMKSSSLMVRGFEPSRIVNDSHWGAAEVLSQMVPAYVESVLESKHASVNGFSKQDVIEMIVTLDQLIFDTESHLLESVYASQKKQVQQKLSLKALKPLLEEYIIKWMVDADPEDYRVLLNNQTLAAQVLPHYWDLLAFVEGRARALEYKRLQKLPPGRGSDVWMNVYSFDDVHQIVGGITRSFQSYWQSECESMKSALVSMDKHATGRVPLANFYNTAINTDWRFGESESYLRELGALDETSKWMGPQVLISNYIQATSNCIVSNSHYLVCCDNECETLLGEIESTLKAPSAVPSEIVAVVSTMTLQTTIDSDEPAHLNSYMISQLEQVAKNNGGMVPLHGRLFAQWLHYIFPRECAFPHKLGVVSSLTPSEYGDGYIASKDAMKEHASNVTDVHLKVKKEELQWMSQWSEDEELLLDYQNDARGRSSWCWLFLIGSGLIAALGLWQGVLSSGGKSMPTKSTSPSLHSHYV